MTYWQQFALRLTDLALLVIAACVIVKAAELVLWRFRLEQRRHARRLRQRINQAAGFPETVTPLYRNIRDDLKRAA